MRAQHVKDVLTAADKRPVLAALVNTTQHLANGLAHGFAHPSDEVGVGVFALDAEDKLLLMPGNDVVVDVQSHELGLGALLNP